MDRIDFNKHYYSIFCGEKRTNEHPFETRQVPIEKLKDIVIKGNDPSKKAEEVEVLQVAFCTIFVFQIKEFE